MLVEAEHKLSNLVVLIIKAAVHRSNQVGSPSLFLLSVVLLPPSMRSTPVRVLESDGFAALSCVNPNSPEVSDGVQWFRVGDERAIVSSGILVLRPISRDVAGEYECRASSRIQDQTASAIAEVIVECKLCYSK